jgi:hypothetical protein
LLQPDLLRRASVEPDKHLSMHPARQWEFLMAGEPSP